MVTNQLAPSYNSNERVIYKPVIYQPIYNNIGIQQRDRSKEIIGMKYDDIDSGRILLTYN